jgi:CRISPR type III-associated protein (TIGR04423 family)
MSTTSQNGRKKVAGGRLPAGNQYEGYLWFSDQQSPEVYLKGDAFADEYEPTANPFIVEGWLYDHVTNKSYAIRHQNGAYLRTEYDLDVIAKDQQPIKYRAHDIESADYYHVVEHWAPEPDPNCEEMPVLRHAWTAFAGFVHPKEK